MSERTPVLIVGGGPVGLALAGELGWRGVACTLIEKTDGAIEQPKMDLVGIRTMEFCRRWGIVDWVRDAPYPRDYPQDYIYVTGAQRLRARPRAVPRPRLRALPAGEPAEARARAAGHVRSDPARASRRPFRMCTLRYNTELMSFRGDAGRRDARRCATSRPARPQPSTADYLVGTDGGASTVREPLGIGMSGNPALTYTTNVMFRCADFPALHDKGQGYRFIFIGPEGTWLTIVAINGGDRFRMSIVGSAEKVNHTEADIRARARRAPWAATSTTRSCR